MNRKIFAVMPLLCVLTAGANDLTAPVVSAAFGPDGRLWRVLPKKNYVAVDYSDDLGLTFSDPRRVNKEKQRIRATPEDRPGILVDRTGRIHVLYFADSQTAWTTYVSSSEDKGRSFSTPTKSSSAADRARHYQDQIFLDVRNQLHIFWIDERDADLAPLPGGVLYHLSTDAGSWANPVNRMLHKAMCECCRFAIDSGPEGNPVLFGRLVIGGDVRDHGLIEFVESGQTADPLRVTNDDWRINACPEHGPALSIGDDGRYHMAWFTLGNNRQGLFYAVSEDRGKTVSEPLQIGSVEKLAGHADVLAHGEMIHLVWRQYDGRSTSIMAMVSTDNGESWLSPATISESTGASDYPFLLTDGSAVYISWYSEQNGYQLMPMPNGDAI